MFHQPRRKVEIDLIDIADLFDGDESAEQLKNTLLPRALSFCMTSEKFLHIGQRERKNKCKPDKELNKQLQSQILRYVKVPDKYLHFISLLIKSREFHLAYQELCPKGKPKPLITLPRTEKGKPFIPLPGGEASDFKFSVSHQKPYLGIGRTFGYEIGIDIVTFDEINKKLYSDESEFLHVFRSSFTDYEWASIITSSSKLNEFYLQWAVKEAYTKALGLGLSLDFKSFSTRFEGVDNLWGHVSTQDVENGICIKGFVRCGDQIPQQWAFFFQLLRFNGKAQGCLCACTRAPSEDKNSTINIDVGTKWLTLEEL
eukprot:CAMPEP_0194212544 /NCGR_PEP_ID=MMETSP0156-20130528/12552_1 /TAXON_ID=33649 /ORGANISM="Thalassionema nitzschioides, Strain L26-B" /LENGTH=313 /DNA_ID=CAMNT_0038940399 /DNA_START=183 /DNA_END=1121 /DNA_ORIENTATION=-